MQSSENKVTNPHAPIMLLRQLSAQSILFHLNLTLMLLVLF